MNDSGQASNKRVLVIDDDATIVDLIKMLLIDEGYQVDVALDGRQALDGDGTRPDVVVLDMFLPGLSGAALADALRAKHGDDLAILVISASNVAAEAKDLGAVRYLSKPFDLNELVDAIRVALPIDGSRPN